MRRQLVVCAAVGIGSALLWLFGGWGIGSLIPCEMAGFGCLGTVFVALVVAVPVTMAVSWLALRLLGARGPALVAVLGPVVTTLFVVGLDRLHVWSLTSHVPGLSAVLGTVPALPAAAAYALVGWLTAALSGPRDAAPGTPPPSPDPEP
ncbi:hypothetical protein Lfu02_38600 [Longispora fulva]|uniref:Uncharacterized protein n=1 Tax=Longispora fulva TaxID=619741 RepID=A0A8J7KZN1_9ACTN|nr:hypothetical protein [Longispora fulva]MBG6141362.1 hypothetical protein [Longispora fulva]GIG59488.1 hypothetical protein Lfu02_38600 [Longispora fulva]